MFPLRFSSNWSCDRQNPLLSPTLFLKLPILPSPPIPRPAVSTNKDFLPILFYFWCCDKIPWQKWKTWELSFLSLSKENAESMGILPISSSVCNSLAVYPINSLHHAFQRTASFSIPLNSKAFHPSPILSAVLFTVASFPRSSESLNWFQQCGKRSQMNSVNS